MMQLVEIRRMQGYQIDSYKHPVYVLEDSVFMIFLAITGEKFLRIKSSLVRYL